MDFSQIGPFLENFKTAKVLAAIQDAELGDMMKTGWFWGSTLGLAVFFSIMRWRGMLISLIIVVGMAWLIANSLSEGTSLESGAGSSNLLVFVCGGAVLIGLVIYLLFIKSD